MYKKLLAGEYGLASTFWKFGVLGTLFALFVVKILGSLLVPQLGGLSIYEYFSSYFNPITMGFGVVAYTVCYLTSLFILLAYNLTMILAVWRSSKSYERSTALGHIAKFLMLLIAYVCLKMVF